MLDAYLDQLLLYLTPRAQLRLAPDCADRAHWEQLPGSVRAQLVREAERFRAARIPELTASDYMAAASGDRRYAEGYQLRRTMLKALVLGECAQGEGRFLADIVDLIWAVCDEASWVLPENNRAADGQGPLPLPDALAPDLDEAAAETAADLSWTVHLMQRTLDPITPQLCERAVQEVRRRALAPLMGREDLTLFDPGRLSAAWCVECLMAAALLSEPEDHRRWACLKRCLVQLDQVLAAYPDDGSTPLGITGWDRGGGAALECLALVRLASDGAVNCFRERQPRLMAHLPAFTHLARGLFAAYGALEDPGAPPAELVYRAGLWTRDEELCGLGGFLYQREQQARRLAAARTPALMRQAMAAFYQEELAAVQPITPDPRQLYLPASQLMVAREQAYSDQGFQLAMHGGHNGGGQAHLDVGDLMVCYGGQPVLVDAGFLEETARHNLPTVGGAGQGQGARFCALDPECELTDGYAMMTLNLAQAYPERAGLRAFQRTLMLLRREKCVRLMEVYDLSVRAPVSFHFTCASEPVLGEGVARIGPVTLGWEGTLAAGVDQVAPPPAFRGQWGGAIYLLTLTAPASDRGAYSFTLTPNL